MPPYWVPDRSRFAPLSGMTSFKLYEKKNILGFEDQTLICDQ